VTSSGASSVFAGFRFPREVISVAVRWYLRYGLLTGTSRELMAERGVTVDHVTIYRWVQRFIPEFMEAARPCRHAPGDRWFADETYVKVAGRWAYLYRAVDQHGRVIDVLLSVRRDLAAARRFFIRALQPARSRPRSLLTAPRSNRVEPFPVILAQHRHRRASQRRRDTLLKVGQLLDPGDRPQRPAHVHRHPQGRKSPLPAGRHLPAQPPHRMIGRECLPGKQTARCRRCHLPGCYRRFNGDPAPRQL
jgi:transposase-like protein